MPTLSWITREIDVKSADAVPYRLLDRSEAYGEDSGNLLIQGDNLEALKSLLPYYRGAVKCVYIDPPFNTGEAFEHYDDNLEHSIWMGVMFPRLSLINELIAEDGTFFIHLDDEEICYAVVILDEIFGRKNRISIVSFKQSSVSGPKSRNPGVVTTNNFLAIYAKNKASWKPHNIYRAIKRDPRYSSYIQNFEDPYAEWRFEPLSAALERDVGMPLKQWRTSFDGDPEPYIERFVLKHRDRVVQLASVAEKDINEAAREKLIKSRSSGRVERQIRCDLDDYYFYNGKQVIFYRSKSREIDGEMTTAERVSNSWDDLLSNNVHKEGGVRFPNGKKPEALIRRCLQIATDPGDLVLDSFLGSGTSAATAHKMGRRWIGIEMRDHAVSHCIPRLQRVIDGEQEGISKAVGWKGGGGFEFYRLGSTVFDSDGIIGAGIKFESLAAHIWFSETGIPMAGAADGPFLGVHDEQGFALLYNGILGDKRVSGGNVLTRKTLAMVRASAGKFIGRITIYGEASRLGPDALKNEDVMFKQSPYDVKAR